MSESRPEFDPVDLWGTPEPCSALTLHRQHFEKKVHQVTNRVYSAVGYSLGNCILIVTDAGNVIVDTTESQEAAEEVKAEFDKISPQPVTAVIYTHGHQDHTHGTAVFATHQTRIYAHRKTKEFLEQQFSQLQPILSLRGSRQFGLLLPADYVPSSGLGPHLRIDRARLPILLPPTDVFDDVLELEIGGVKMVLHAAPGETDDQIFIWVPDEKVLLSADNYYPAFPNLYTIRGTTPRPVQQWIQSLDKMRDLEPEYLVPSHTQPLYGRDQIVGLLTRYRDAIEYVHDAVVRGANQGKTPDQLVEEIRLPPSLAEQTELLELYGKVSEAVRAIYDGYLGWFDGNATNLEPLAPKERAQRIAKLSGGVASLEAEVTSALHRRDFQWAAELSDIILQLTPDSREVRFLKAEALFRLGEASINSNSRSYYFYQAFELTGQIQGKRVARNARRAYAAAMPIDRFFAAMPVWLNPDISAMANLSANVCVVDVDQWFIVNVRKGVAEVRQGQQAAPLITVEVRAQDWKELILGVVDPQSAVTEGRVALAGDSAVLAELVAVFQD
ncbi:alkyl sulfatase dimerization domain-containing protein [Alicyclobacillus sp. ALC3]|uniref:alkyl sulfatase dimerization domain-containing protein n=1 Tax=Alicyclobacillus sp. ALC3 TaxID=2796143 RepID=UPI002379EFEB|nr:alkyl sulfatase dimerization domain-containing protein [Alicyclobacillus sp. ALC3]WDL97713.1 MBL fold metallo-hydrolase [Alicyclobacillus sp. ALC3]